MSEGRVSPSSLRIRNQIRVRRRGTRVRLVEARSESAPVSRQTPRNSSSTRRDFGAIPQLHAEKCSVFLAPVASRARKNRTVAAARKNGAQVVGKRTAARKNGAQVVGTRKLVNSQSSPRSWERESRTILVQGFAVICLLGWAAANFILSSTASEDRIKLAAAQIPKGTPFRSAGGQAARWSWRGGGSGGRGRGACPLTAWQRGPPRGSAGASCRVP